MKGEFNVMSKMFTPVLLIDYLELAGYLELVVAAGLIVLAIFSFYYFLYFVECLKTPKKFEKGKTKYRYAVLIPARNESHVIGNLLASLKKQDYDPAYFDVYAIVESKDDPTCQIVEEFGYHYIVRTRLENRKTKGFALQEAIEYLKEQGLHYDSYMIFDADNIAEPNFIRLLNDSKNQGYQVSVGYRNFTNSKKNWVSACSATLFAYMNQFTSKGRSAYFEKATLTGTGYYVDADVVEGAGGWIWTGMTEDVALTTYCYYHNVSMHYYPYAVYYDEQPTSFKVLHKQHIRWIFGYMEKKDKYKSKEPMYHEDHMVRRRIGIMEYNLCIWPLVSFFIFEIIAALGYIALFILAALQQDPNAGFLWGHMVLQISLLYLALCLAGLISVVLDRKHLQFGFWKSLVVILTYPFFMCDFLFAFFDGLFHKKKRTTWDRIAHSGEITNEEAKEVEDGKKGR